MDSRYVKAALVEEVLNRASDRFPSREVENSISQIAARWVFVLGYHEKKAIARSIGGSKYATSTRLLLDALFEGIVSEDSER